MPEPLEVDYLKPYIDATIAASSRFRRVLIVLIVASILGFSAFWNSRQGSWIHSRLSLARKTGEYFLLKERKVQAEQQIDTKNQAVQAGDERLTKTADEKERETLRNEQETLKKEIASLSAEIKKIDENLKNYGDADQWIKDRGLTNKEEVEKIAEGLEDVRTEYVTLIRIPFFGIVMDVNDLGLLGGFTFVVVLMWFRFSLWREYNNLRTTFLEVEDEHLKYCYMTLAMNQVLTVPPALAHNQPPEKPWGKVVRWLYFLPVIVQSLIFIHDCITFYKGRMVNELNTIIAIAAGLTFLVLCAMLAYMCYRLSGEIDGEWKKQFARLQKQLEKSRDN